MNGIHLRDLWRMLGWMLVHLLILALPLLIYWLIGVTTVFEHSILWSLAGMATLLILARKKGHFALVLGLCSLGFWIKVEPFLGLYLLMASAVLFGALRIGNRHRRKLFWVSLILLVILIPKFLPLLFAAQPTLWLWLRESLLLGFFLRYAWYESVFNRGELQEQRFFEHVGYILFIPQLFKLLNVAPFEYLDQEQKDLDRLWSAGKMFLLGTFKLLFYQVHLLIPLGLQQAGAGSWLGAWYQIFTHAALWFLWLSAHYDYAVGVARILGVPVPANFHFPLLATSPRDFWRRWHTLHHHFLKEMIYQPLGGRQRLCFAIFCTFLASSFIFSAGWIGSQTWLLTNNFIFRWFPFFMVQALLVYLQIRCCPSRLNDTFLWRLGGWMFTQTSFSLSCLLLAGLGRFPLDTISTVKIGAVLRKALFFD
jgi:D-alanyl-lipoteichoic acid acyltransferase DltB (MBOAT superfamily)